MLNLPDDILWVQLAAFLEILSSTARLIFAASALVRTVYAVKLVMLFLLTTTSWPGETALPYETASNPK